MRPETVPASRMRTTAVRVFVSALAVALGPPCDCPADRPGATESAPFPAAPARGRFVPRPSATPSPLDLGVTAVVPPDRVLRI